MLEIAVGVLVAVGVYLILHINMIKKIIGVIVLSTAINIALLLCGTIQFSLPAFVGDAVTTQMSNPLPQALALTAIVIGFSLLALLCALAKKILSQVSAGESQ